MSDAVVETIDLTMRFGGVTAVDRVNFALKERELRCLIGPNGAGKSTFFKCLTGQYRLNSANGRVFIRGADVVGMRPHEIVRMGVGIKTQVPSVMNGLTVMENLWLAARRAHGWTRATAEVQRVIDEVGLADIARRTVGELAHGQRQMVEIGIVLAQDPWLILLDEPAAGITGAEVEKLVSSDPADQPERLGHRGGPRHGVRAHARREHHRVLSGGGADRGAGRAGADRRARARGLHREPRVMSAVLPASAQSSPASAEGTCAEAGAPEDRPPGWSSR